MTPLLCGIITCGFSYCLGGLPNGSALQVGFLLGILWTIILSYIARIMD